MQRTGTVIALLFSIAVFGSPVRAQLSVVSDLSQDKEAAPGEVYEGTILVKNDGKEPQEFKAYQTDYLFSCDGTSIYGDPGTTPRSNARWIRFNPSTAVIPPQTAMTIGYTVTVPENAPGKELIGTYWSMVMVEGITKESPESSRARRNKKVELGIRTSLRYGVQIATHIAHTGTRSIRFIDTKLTAGPKGGRQLQVDLEDNGTLGFRPEVYVDVFDSKGTSMGRFPGSRSRMYPGTSVRQLIDLGKLAPGTYKALVVVDAGGDDVFGAQYTLEF